MANLRIPKVPDLGLFRISPQCVKVSDPPPVDRFFASLQDENLNLFCELTASEPWERVAAAIPQTEEPNPRTLDPVRLSGFGSFRRKTFRNAICFYVSMMGFVCDIDHASM